MPLTRYRVRREYGLADPELYRAADKDDPEALLEGVAMAGLVGVLRQLGDLAEFAAEIFHDLHEEVMATATRGHGLMVRVQQLEAEFPPIEKALLSQTNLSSFFYNPGVDWHPNLRSEQNLIARGDLPRFVMDSYEEARAPPRLFLLDKFDVAGAGACLKRYTDPSFFKMEAASSGMGTVEIQREKKNRKVKKKGLRWRNGETTPEVVPTSHTKLHQLFLEERIENGHSDPACLVKLKKRQLNRTVVDSKTGKSYMEKFVETPPERELACETSIIPAPFTSSDYTSESGIRILEISTVSPVEYSPRNASACSSLTAHEVELKPSMDGVDKEVVDAEIVKVVDPSLNDERVGRSSTLHEIQVEKQLPINGEEKTKGSANGYESDDVTSEVDNYMDALASMELEMETDNGYRFNGNLCFLKADTHGADFDAHEEHLESRAQLSDSHSLGNFSTSDDGVKEFPSAKVSGAEIVNEQSHELSASVGAISDEHVVSHRAFIKEESIPVHEDASRSPLQDDLYSTAVYSDPGASLSATSPLRTEGGTPMECITRDSKVPDAVDNGTYLVDFAPQVSSQIDGDFTATSAGYYVDESDAVLHLSNISEASEKENRDSSGNEVLQTEDEVENSNKNLVSDEIDSPRISVKEKQLTSSSPDIETCSENYNFPAAPDHSEAAEPGDLESKLDDIVSATGVNSEDLPTMVDTAKSHISEEVPSRVDSPQTTVLKEQQHPDFSEGIPHLEPDLAESDVQHSKEEPIIEEISGTRHFEETGLSTSYVDSDGSNVFSLERPSRILTDPGDNDHADLDFVASRTVVVEDQSIYSAGSTNVVDSVSNDICSTSGEVSSPSRNPTNLQESLPGFVDPIQNEVELDDRACPEDAKESETRKEQHQEEVAFTDSGLNSSTPVSYDRSSYKIDDINDDLSPDERTQNSLSVIDITAASSLDLRDQESEIISSNNYHLDDQEYALSLPTSSQPVPDTPSEKSLKLRADQVGENSVTDDAGSHPETLLEHSELRADQFYVSCLQGDRPSIASSSLPSEETAPVNHMGEERDERIESRKPTNQEIDVDASLESSREEDLPSQFSTSQFSSKSAAPEVGNMKQESNPLESALPGVRLRPEAAQGNLGEMPPMPPLPPMQWRMGKFQHAFLDGNRGLFLPIQPLGAAEKAQVELPASQSGVQHPQSLFLPLTVIENEKSLHVSDPLAGSFSFAQPSTYSLQLPTTVNDANNQYNYLSLGGTQPLNPFFTLPVVSSERHGYGYLASEGEIVQPGSSSFPPTPTTQCTTTHKPNVSPVIQPLNQQAPKEDSMTHQQSLQSSEGEEGNPFAKSIPPPPVAEEQVRLGLLMPEGGTPWSSNNSSIMPESEVGKPNGNPVNKLPRPRNPLIDAVNAHGKSKLRKVTERARPQIGPKVDERGSLLEQIRTKSFNLKPATATRSSIPGPTPKTNLKVAAILEKANAIRQALAGSDDEHDDDDSWSDA